MGGAVVVIEFCEKIGSAARGSFDHKPWEGFERRTTAIIHIYSVLNSWNIHESQIAN